MSVLEDALLAFPQTFGWEMKAGKTARRSRPRAARGEA
jgi:hypothetical protein